ncbi:MAG: hypothetical protein WKF47_05615 [Geodermatophilaceae bacterium]
MRGATLTGANPAGDALDAYGLKADSAVVLDEKFTSVGGITFSSADIGNPAGWNQPRSSACPGWPTRLGWRTRDLHGVGRDDRRAAAKWLDTQQNFVSEPWQEIAAVYERNGQPADPAGGRLGVHGSAVGRGHGATPRTDVSADKRAILIPLLCAYALSTGSARLWPTTKVA